MLGLLLSFVPFSAYAETQNVCIQDYTTITQVQELVDSGALYLMSTGNCMSNSTYPLPSVSYVYNPGTVALWQRYECSTSSARWKFYGWTNSGTHTNDDCYDVDVALLPEPPEPSNCSDGVMTASTDETGIDCGGSCLASCTTYCPVGWTNYSGSCYSPEIDMINGLCPEGTTIQNNTDQTCMTSTAITYASDTYDNSVLDDTSPTWVFNDENSPWVSNVTENTVDNLDGTSTTTTTTTTTVNNYDGTTTTTNNTTTAITNNTTGALISSNDTGSTTEQTVSNYDTSTVEGEYDGTLQPGIDYPDEDLFTGMLDSFADGVSGLDAFTGSGITTSDPLCSIQFAEYEISFCGEPYTGYLTSFSALLVAFTYLASLYIVFRR